MTFAALAVGVATGVGAVIFRALIGLFHNLFFFGRLSFIYDASLHTAPSTWGVWVIVMPVLGALCVAFLVKTFAPEAKGHGVPEVIDTIYYQRGAIRPVVAAIKSLASSLTIGSGGSVGREGPIVQIGSAIGSTLGKIFRMLEWERITLVACGAAGGIAATFNTPIGGLLFAVELLAPEISARTLIPIALAAGCATSVGRWYFGDHPAFDIPGLALPLAHQFTLGAVSAYVVLGLILGLVSAVFIRSIYSVEDLFDRMPGNYYIRHTLGMLLVGILMYLCLRYFGHYYIEGVGYATIQDVLDGGPLLPSLLFVLFVLKMLATALTLGSGGSGGIFSPSLFLGATFGAAYALFVERYLPTGIEAASTAVIGMACMVGATTGAAVTAIVMIFEMTRDYNVIIPVMVSVSCAYGIRTFLLADNIYTMKLTRRGHFVPTSFNTGMYMLRSVGEFASREIRLIDADATMHALGLSRFSSIPHVLLVKDHKLRGVVPSARIARMRRSGDLDRRLVEEADEGYVLVASKTELFLVIARMREHGKEVAVITQTGNLHRAEDVVGVLTWRDVSRHAGNLLERLQPNRGEGDPAARDRRA